MSGLSFYFHATLYVFKGRAVTAITTRFDETVQNPDARCWWDSAQEMFCLECPEVHAFFCDETLGNIIEEYITTELEAADDEDREPDIIRYPQSKFDRLDSVPAEEQPEEEEIASLQPPPAQTRPVTTHIIVTGEGEGKKVKFFRIHRLPEEFLRRALSPQNQYFERLLHNGYTCRAVREDSKDGFVFNGRDGRNAAPTSSHADDLLNAINFAPLEDTRERSESDDDQKLLVNQWEHVDGAPRVEDWVRGVGRTRPISAENEEEADEDGDKQVESKGPAALVPLVDSSSDGSDEISAPENEQRQPISFGDLFTGPTIAERSDEDASEPDKGTLIPLRARATAQPKSKPAQLEWSTIMRPPPQAQPVIRDQTNRPSALGLSFPTPPLPATESNFPDWGSRYSKVDKVGLLAPAAATAEYELHTHASRPAPKPKKRSIVARTSKRDYGSTTATSEIQENDEEVVDRLGVPSPNFARTMDTMNQKAGRKSKGAKGKKSAFKAELPLPDPVPAPKPKKNVQATLSDQTPAISDEVRTAAAAAESSGDAFTRMLNEVLKRHHQDDDTDSEDDEALAPVKAEIKLVAQTGILLCRSVDKAFGSQETSAPGAVQETLNAMSDEVTAVLLPRITTSDSDAAYLSGLFGATSAQVEASYEIFVRDINGWQLKVTVPAEDKSAFTIKAHDRAIGQACLHYPIRVWDASMTLVEPGIVHQSASQDAITDFVSSMHTDGDAPSFRAFVAPAQFMIDGVVARRVFSYELDGMKLCLLETQDLEVFRPTHWRHYNFLAKAAESRDDMVADHRLWWEAKIETNDLHRAEQMRSRIDGLVNGMDGVGLGNVGPWDFPDEQDHDEEEIVPGRVIERGIEW